MRILPITEREGLTEFIELPGSVHRDDPVWIPPMREQVLHELSRCSPFGRYGRHQLFLCETDGHVAGRIAALVNPKLIDPSGNVLGQLGYFECIDDPAVGASLIGAGIEWLRREGARQVLAPMNGAAHRTHRFMTRGFDLEPFLFEPRNPPYYPTFFQQCGFATVHRWFSYDLSRRNAARLLNRYERVLSKIPAPGQIEELNVYRAQDTITRIHKLLDGCWEGHVGFAPLDIEEFAEVFRGALSIMPPGSVGVFVSNAGDLGFALNYPDYARDVRALQGHGEGWGRWLGTSHPKRIVLHTAALVPEARKTAAVLALVAWAFHRALAGEFEDVLVALAVEGFLSKIGEQTREYALYSRLIN